MKLYDCFVHQCDFGVNGHAVKLSGVDGVERFRLAFDPFDGSLSVEEIDRVFAWIALCPDRTFHIVTAHTERMREYLEGIMYQRVGGGAQTGAAARVMTWPRFYNIIEEMLDQGCPESASDPEHGGCDPSGCAFKTEAEWDHAHRISGDAADPKKWPLPNVWLGAAVENQEQADARVPGLLRCPAAVRFLSCEPLLGAVDLLIDSECSAWRCPDCGSRNVDNEHGDGEDFSGWACGDCGGFGEPGSDAGWDSNLHWVIVGGEGGADARACDVAWVRAIVNQCRDAGVPAFVSQLGAKPGWTQPPPPIVTYRDGPRVASPPPGCAPVPVGWNDIPIDDPNGADPDEWPEDLRVREFPAREGAS